MVDGECQAVDVDEATHRKLLQSDKLYPECTCGYLVGIRDSNRTVVVDFVGQYSSLAQGTLRWPTLSHHDSVLMRFGVPTGFQFIGFWFKSSEEDFKCSLDVPLDAKMPSAGHWKETNDCLVVQIDLLNNKMLAYVIEEQEAREITLKVQENAFNDLLTSFTIVRLEAVVNCEWEDGQDLKRETHRLHDVLLQSVFHFQDANVVLHNQESCQSVSNRQLGVLEGGRTFATPVTVQCYHGNITNDIETKHPCPLLSCSHRTGFFHKASIPVDMLVAMPTDITKKDAWQLLHTALMCSVDAWFAMWQAFPSNDKIKYATFASYHFLPPGCNCSISVMYPTQGSSSCEDSAMATLQQDVQRRYLLRSDRPYFRSSTALFSSYGEDSYLINPHLSIVPKQLLNHQISLVDGCYAYRHYMQDGMDDDGWGCAYRSLQTIFSWFKRQGYTTKPIPSHSDIQKALVAIGDKSKNMIGSRQWIGSFEVGLCLENMLGVQSRILHCSAGIDMPSKARELLQHFSDQGSPVMIGGGVLAHTIIGIDLDELSGATSYLILDPHYTGQDDLKTVLKKGWCGWKKTTFWDKNAHYNMCLPQRPDYR